MDLYEVILLLPKTGNRILISGCEADVEANDVIEPETTLSGHQFFHKKGATTRLDIVLTIHNPDYPFLDEVREQIINENIFIYFKDVHPNLIKSIFRGMTKDSQKITMSFTGNATDKEYLDYVTEVSTQLNAQQIHWQSKPIMQSQFPLASIDPKPDPIKKRKVRELKRKLTFK
jgi:hypothetical protein